MAQLSRQRRAENIYLLFLFIAGVALVMLVTAKYGPAVGGDSVDYLATAENIADGEGFRAYGTKAYTSWPPLYPLLLGALNGLFGLDLFLTGWIVNALAFGGTMALAGVLIRRVFPERRIWFYLGTLITLFSWSILRAAAGIGADALFILLTMLYLLTAQNMLVDPRPRNIYALAAISGLGAVLRWNGTVFIATGVLLLLYLYRHHWQKALRRGLAFGGLASLPMVLWMGRNYFSFGSFFGRRVPYNDLFANAASLYARVVHWFLPLSVTERVPAAVFGAAALAAIVVINRRDDWTRFGRWFLKQVSLPIGIYTIFYVVVLLLTTTNAEHPDIFDDRYLAPVFVIAWLLVFLVLDGLVLPHLRVGARWKDYLTGGIILLWLLYPANVLRKYAILSLEQGVLTYNDYNNARFNESEIMQLAQSYDYDEDASISTNYPDAVYFFTGLDILEAPKEEGFGTLPSREGLDEALDRWQGGPEGYLIWFWPNSFKRYYPPDLLEDALHVTVIHESGEGGLYYITED